nr:hypothetical protein CFP56_10073 [Quercus suber]
MTAELSYYLPNSHDSSTSIHRYLESANPDTTHHVARFHDSATRMQAYYSSISSPEKIWEVESTKTQIMRSPELFQRQSCSGGTAFYVCANGFRGCCSTDPCDPGGWCPDASSGLDSSSQTAKPLASSTSETGRATSLADSVSTKAATVSATDMATSISSAHTPELTTVQITSPSSLAASTSAIIFAATSLAASITTSFTTSPTTALETSLTSSMSKALSSSIPVDVPTCPVVDNTTYVDPASVVYTVQCATDNNAPSTETVQIGTGGYGQCFSACSSAVTCAGFTFSGFDSGKCFLKASMPSDSNIAGAGSDYVTCAKVSTSSTPSAGSTASSEASGPGSGKKLSIGAIAGTTVGIAFVLVLLLILLCICTTRRKRNAEQRSNMKVTHISHGPLRSLPMTNTDASTGRRRSSSISSYDIWKGNAGKDHLSFPDHVHTRNQHSRGKHRRRKLKASPTKTPTVGIYASFNSILSSTEMRDINNSAYLQRHAAFDASATNGGASAEKPMSYAALHGYNKSDPRPDNVAMLDSTPIDMLDSTPIEMLDSTPVAMLDSIPPASLDGPSVELPTSGPFVASIASRLPHLPGPAAEMEDTSLTIRHSSKLKRERMKRMFRSTTSSSQTDSPTLGRRNDVRLAGSMRTRLHREAHPHLMMWNVYRPGEALRSSEMLTGTMSTPSMSDPMHSAPRPKENNKNDKWSAPRDR